MSWQGYLNWLEDQKDVLRDKLENRPVHESRELINKILNSLSRTFILAEKKGEQRRWLQFSETFQLALDEVEKAEMSYDEAWDNYTAAEDDVFSKAKKYYKDGDYENALSIFQQVYDEGQKEFQIVEYIIECFNHLEESQKLADFLANVLSEDKYPPKHKALLYYKLGLAHLKLGKYSLARQSLWQVRKFVPNFPGLQEKLQEIERYNKKAKSRFDLLIDKKVITWEQVEEAMQKAKKENKDVDQLLIEQYKVAKDQLGDSLQNFYDVDFVAFDPQIEPPFELFEKRRLDPDFLKRYGWVPFAQKGKNIEVLMVNPYDLGKIDEIRFILGTSSITPKVSLKQDIDAFIDHFYKELSGDEELSQFDEEVVADSDEQDDYADMEDMVTEEDSEVVRLVNALLVEAWKQGASDIHIEPNPASKYCAVRFRVDGSCFEFKKFRFNLARPLVSRIKIMSRLDIAERRLPQDGKVKLKLPNINKVVEFRVATMPVIENQEEVVLRVLASGKPLPLNSLGLSERNLKHFQEAINQPYGMVLVVGPTGSGKTTTLHSAMSEINTPDKKIWTAEDPVEITQVGLHQVQVNSKIGLTFASSLRSFLRADPDVIMIGEMRDEETANIGVEASLTGHLVFSTLHTNTAPETITRLLDMNLDPFNFADSLICVLGQRLIRTLCSSCKEEYKPDKQELEELKAEFGPDWKKHFSEDFMKNPRLFRPKGCKKCIQGYKGRMGIHELMLNSDQIKHLVKFRKTTEELYEQARHDGMLTLKQDGILKVLNGSTDINQVRKVAGKK